MRIQARILVVVLGRSRAFLTQTRRLPSPGEIIPSDIHDPFGLVSRHAQFVTLASGFGFTEGPAVDRRGNVFFTDQPNDRIYRWTPVTGKRQTLSGRDRSRQQNGSSTVTETSLPVRTCTASCGRSARMDVMRCWSTTIATNC